MSERFSRLIKILEQLRGEQGCPWDKEQTRDSIKPFLVEEGYEVLEAIEQADAVKLKEELGDLLLQIVFHCQIAKEQHEFDAEDVLDSCINKTIRRHPHVFGDQKVKDQASGSAGDWPGGGGHLPAGRQVGGATVPHVPPQIMTTREVLSRWEDLKRQERGSEGLESLLEGLPKSLPALIQALRVQERVSRVGFDWPSLLDVGARAATQEAGHSLPAARLPDGQGRQAIPPHPGQSPAEPDARPVPDISVGVAGIAGILDKVREEIEELEEAIRQNEKKRIEEELGDLLFTLVNLARFNNVDPEGALRGTTHRFIDRFKEMDQIAKSQGWSLQELSLIEMNALWEQSKNKMKD